MPSSPMPSSPGLLPALALMVNAFVWGVSWWPFRQLQSHGLHPLWATVLVYLVAVAVIAVARPHAFGQVLRRPVLWVLVLASGATNAAFNWGVAIGDVVRVVLLFYLMPLWVVLLARVLLGERLTWLAGVRVLLALAGAAVVLWPEQGGSFPLPRSLPDWLGVCGGFAFGLNNVMLRREAHQPEESRALAMFLGGVLVAGSLASVLALQGDVAWPPMPSFSWVPLALVLSVFFLVSNAALQYGAARLPANVASVVMLTEVLFASVSALLLCGGHMTLALAMGGGLILLAALLSTLENHSGH
jgi:drug/metabolite transporter (DMT)-like permease